MCKYMQQNVNQGIWWCDLQFKDKDSNTVHLNCDCRNCPDREEEDYGPLSFTTANSKSFIEWEKVSEI